MSQFPTQQLSQAPNQQPPIGASPDLNAQLLAILQQQAAQRPAAMMAAPLPVAMFGDGVLRP